MFKHNFSVHLDRNLSHENTLRNIISFFLSETKKNILIEEKIQEKEEIQEKEKKTREG